MDHRFGHLCGPGRHSACSHGRPMAMRGPRGHETHGPWQGPERHGRGSRRRLFDAGELRLVLLRLIAERPRHGYDLITALEAMTGGSYAPSPGIIYPTLTLLQDMGLIAEEKAEGPRKIFAVTEEGRAHLVEAEARAEAVFARLSALAAEQDRPEDMPVRRAMENLKSVLRNQLMGREPTPETVNAIVEILDDSARRIERL